MKQCKKKNVTYILSPSFEDVVDDNTELVQTTSEEPLESGLRRSAKSRQSPDFYNTRVSVASEDLSEPTSSQDDVNWNRGWSQRND